MDRESEKHKEAWGGSIICRGGCYYSSASDLRVSRRRQVLGGQGLMSVGFRCARDVDVPEAETSDNINDTKKEAVPDNKWHDKLDNISAHADKNFRLCMGVGDPSHESGGLTEEKARRIKNIGYTSVEQYVTWKTVEGKGKDFWCFDKWDQEVSILKKAGLKWVPFLIAGPTYSLPGWYRESSDYKGLKCLEHNIESGVQSIWDERFRWYIERFISKIAEHYGDKDVLEAVILGITGDFGEPIYPVWHGNWPTQIHGLYHSHSGYWCGDRFARQDFKEKMLSKFGDIGKLNEWWGTRFPAVEAVEMPEVSIDKIDGFRVDEFTGEGEYTIDDIYSRRRWLDFIDWYRQSMTDYSSFWMGVTRKYFPDIPIYLCTGGDASPSHGSEFAQQCKVCAKHRGGVRITNEASYYPLNFVITNWVSSAGKHYNAYFGFEPAGMITEKGVVCRIYNATASGAEELHFYEGNIFDKEEKADLFIDNLKYLYTGKPRKHIGVMYPDTSITLEKARAGWVLKNSTDYTIYMNLRDYTDYRFIDDLTINDGILNEIKYVMICGGEIYKKKTLDALTEWVMQGGVLIGYNLSDLRCAEYDESYGDKLFNLSGGEKVVGKGFSLYIPGELKKDAGFCQKNIFDPITAFLAKHGYHVADGVIDGVYAAELHDRVFLLNTGDSEVEKAVVMSDGSKKTLTMKPNSMGEILY
ncbi:MAG: family 14 glycosylhydrolase [Spirochaetota bacterium]